MSVERCEEVFIVRGVTAHGVVESWDCTLSPDEFSDRFRIFLEAGTRVEIRVEDFSYSGPNIALQGPDGSYYTVLVGLLNEYGVEYEITVW